MNMGMRATEELFESLFLKGHFAVREFRNFFRVDVGTDDLHARLGEGKGGG